MYPHTKSDHRNQMDVNPFVLVGILVGPAFVGIVLGRIVNIDPPGPLVYLAGGLFVGGQILALFTMRASQMWGVWIPMGMVLSPMLLVGYAMGCQFKRDDEAAEQLDALQPPRSHVEPQIMDATGFPTQRPRE